MQSSYTEHWSFWTTLLNKQPATLITEIPVLLSLPFEHRDPEFIVNANGAQHLVKSELTEGTKERQGVPYTAHNASARLTSSGMLRHVVW